MVTSQLTHYFVNFFLKGGRLFHPNITFAVTLSLSLIRLSKMAGTGPRVATTPLELLNNQETNETPWLSKYINPMWMGTVCVVGVIVGNYASKRPIWSGIQKHVMWGAAGVGAGFVLEEWRNQHLAKRDAIFRHYIELHPEDFPPYERKLYRDVFEEWIPIR